MTQAVDDLRATTESRLTMEGELLRRIALEDSFGLLRVLGSVAAARDPNELCTALLERGLCARIVELAIVARLDEESASLVVVGRAGAQTSSTEPVRLPIDLASPMTTAVRDDAVIVLRDEAELRDRFGLEAAIDRDRVFVAVPLRSQERIVGVLGVRLPRPIELSIADRAVLLLLGARLGPVLERVIAHAKDHEARREAEASATRLLGMARISRELAEAGLDERELIERAARGVAEVFGDACLIKMLDGAELESMAVDHPDPTVCAELLRFGHADAEPVRATITRGRAILLKGVHRRTEGHAPLRKSSPIESLMSAPITLSGTSCGVILLVRRTGAPYSEQDRMLLEDVSHRVGLALSAARAFGAQQEARERAEEATRGRDHVLSIVTHDLRAPLATVHLAASLLGEMDPDHEGFEDVVGRIARASSRMRRLVDDLLDLGQLESGALTVRRTRVPLRRVLEETADELQERARAAQKTLACSLPEVAIDVLGDFERLQQLLVNLVVNAIDHTPAGTWIVLGAALEHDRARVWVEDDGPGLEPELAERLFEPGVRGSRTTVHGAGLGLWIAKGLVEAHGGELSVSSAPGEGTRFELSLPLVMG